MKRFKFPIAIFFILACFLFIQKRKKTYSRSISSEPSQTSLYSKDTWVDFLTGVSEINSIWTSGDYPYLEEMHCYNFYWKSMKQLVSSEFLKCNPIAMNCFLDELSKTHNSIFEFSDKKNLRLAKRVDFLESGQGVTLEMNYEGKVSRKVVLENHCHETFLPKGKKIFSPQNFDLHLDREKREDSYSWENEKNIFIDKFLVSHLDVLGSGNDQLINDFANSNQKLFHPITNLNLNEMKNYCHSQGKKLLTAKLYDAMVMNGTDLRSLKVNRRANCRDLYHLECFKQKKKFYFYNTDNVSSIGTYDIQGGVLEAVDNEKYPYFNIVASSMYFPKGSHWHKLTHRFHWDGEDFTERNFRFKSSVTGETLEPIRNDNIKVGFRCYREN